MRRLNKFEFVKTNRWVRDKKTRVDKIEQRDVKVLDAAFINSKSDNASSRNDLYVVEFEDGHKTMRYRDELKEYSSEN